MKGDINRIYHFVEEVFQIQWNRQTSISVIDELEYFAKRGVRYRLVDIAELYFHPSKKGWQQNWYAKFMAKKLIVSLKARLAKKGKWYGTINSKHQYGFIETEREHEYVNRREMKRVKGVIKNMLATIEFAKRNGIYDENW